MFAEAYPHDDLLEIYPNVFLLHGSIRMGPGLRMNRNMMVLKEGNELTLINPVRMNEQGLASLDTLGAVKNIIRLGDFHGLDDPFYLQRYQCDFWAQPGQGTYPQPEPTKLITAATQSQIPDAEFFIFSTATYPEACLLLKQHRLLITTDSIQYYSGWRYFSRITKLVFKLMGFKQGLNIGGPWVKRVTPNGGSLKPDFDELMTKDFDALIAAHGGLLSSNAKSMIQQEMDKVFG
jgi:hypothetical protein